ncbi:MAG: ABC transporter permease [Eubacterium sp.]
MAEIFSGFFAALPGAVAQGLIWGVMAIGVFITFRVLDVADLTVDGTMSTGGAVMVVCMGNGLDVWVSMILSVIAGCIAGFVTGMFHTKFGIPAILAGILTQLSLYSINLRILGGRANAPLSFRNHNLIFSLNDINKSLILGAVFVVVLIGFLYWLFGTELGHGIRATGCNEAMSRANGINTDTNKVIGLVLSNGIVALSGAMLCQYQGFADINMGRGAIVIGLAAVIIGEVIFGKIFKNFALRLLAVALGGVIYYVVITFVLRLKIQIGSIDFKFDPNDLKLFTALVVALFLGVPFWKAKIAQKTVKNKKEVKA